MHALRAFALECRQSAPAIEAQISIPEPEIQQVVAALCDRYGAGLHKKPRQRLLTITAPRTFIDVALQPLIQKMINIVLTARHQHARRIVEGLRKSGLTS